MAQFVTWWVLIEVFGLAALPITRRVLRWLPDEGYSFSKVTGLLLVSYLLWLGASGGVIANNAGGILLALGLVAGLSAWLALRGGWRQSKAAAWQFWRTHWKTILWVEGLFLVAFAGWTLVRAYAPSKIVFAYGEKYMEIAFLNGILQSHQFPPLDPWLAGYAISYYYFGYVMMAVMTRLSGAAPTVGFDLYDALLFALTASAAFGVVYNLIAASTRQAAQRAARGFALLGPLFVVGMGNLEGVIQGLYSAGWLPAKILAWLAIPGLAQRSQSGSFFPGYDFFYWWWWRASRVLNDVDLFNQPVGAQPISEFPFFSFLLGDNHPHKLALPFVILAIGLALNLFLRQVNGQADLQLALPAGLSGWRRQAGWVTVRASGIGLFLFLALALGGLAFLNTWDFPIYLGLTLLAYLVGNYMRERRFTRRNLVQTLLLGVGLGAGALGLYLLFYIGFASQAGGVLPYVFPPTRLTQYALIFGPFLFILAFFLPTAVKAAKPNEGFPWGRAWRNWLGLVGASLGVYLLILAGGGLLLAGGQFIENGFANPMIQEWTGGMSPLETLAAILTARLVNPWLLLALTLLIGLGLLVISVRARVPQNPPEAPWMNNANGAVVFAVLLAMTGLGLTLITEFVYLRDVFGVRMNTVFKFYFQGWVLMGLASAYGVWWLLQRAAARRWVKGVFTVGVGLLVGAGLVYTLMGIYSRDYGYTLPPHMDAAATIAGKYAGHWNAEPDDWAAIEWLRSHAEDTPVILEAPGPGYVNNGRVSAFTGFPTLLGWSGHEDQWRGNSLVQNERRPVIEQIYTTSDGQEALMLLQAWQVRYVVLGDAERAFIQETCANAQTACSTRAAVEKFSQVLKPVFTQGSMTLYETPPDTLP